MEVRLVQISRPAIIDTWNGSERGVEKRKIETRTKGVPPPKQSVMICSGSTRLPRTSNCLRDRFRQLEADAAREFAKTSRVS